MVMNLCDAILGAERHYSIRELDFTLIPVAILAQSMPILAGIYRFNLLARIVNIWTWTSFMLGWL